MEGKKFLGINKMERKGLFLISLIKMKFLAQLQSVFNRQKPFFVVVNVLSTWMAEVEKA